MYAVSSAIPFVLLMLLSVSSEIMHLYSMLHNVSQSSKSLLRGMPSKHLNGVDTTVDGTT